MSEKKSCHNCLNVSKYTDDKGVVHMSCDEYGFNMLGFPANCDPPHDDACNYWTDDPTNSFWDLLVYNRELSNKEVDDYDLKFLGVEDD